jgi:hypothetical protein
MAMNAAPRKGVIEERRPPRPRRAVLAALALVPLAAAPAQAGAPAPVPAAALRHATIAIGDEPVGAVAGRGGVWAVGSDFVQRIDPRTNELMGPRISTGRAVDVTVDRRGIWVTRLAEESLTGLERVRLARATGAQIGDPRPVPQAVRVDAKGTGHRRLSRGWEIETPDGPHGPPVAVRRDFYGAEIQRAELGMSSVTSTAVDGRAALWVGGSPGARRVRPNAEGAEPVVPAARGGAVAIYQQAAWVVGQSARRRGAGVALTKRLYRVDLRTGRQVGEPLTLGTVVRTSPDVAVNRITAGRGSAWISGPRVGTLTRVYLR